MQELIKYRVRVVEPFDHDALYVYARVREQQTQSYLLCQENGFFIKKPYREGEMIEPLLKVSFGEQQNKEFLSELARACLALEGVEIPSDAKQKGMLEALENENKYLKDLISQILQKNGLIECK